MKRYWKGSDMRLDINITDKKGEEIPLSSIMSMTIYLFTSGQEYVEYNYPQSILEDDKGLYIPINENALANLPDGLLRWEANFKVKDIEWPDGRDIVKSCQTDIFVKTPRDYVSKPNVQAKEISITENGKHKVLPDAGYEGINSMTINVDIPMSIKVGANGIKFSYSTFTEIPQVFDFSDVTSMSYMFSRCSYLTTIPEMDVSNVTMMDSMCRSSSSLTDLGGFVGLKCDLDLSSSSHITHDSLMNVINKAADVTTSPATLRLGSTNLAKLTDEEKAVATSKGWTLA